MAEIKDDILHVKSDTDAFHEKLYAMQVNGSLTDFDLLAGNQCYPCHALVLAVASPRLRRDMKAIKRAGLKHEIYLKNFREEIMKELIHYLYLGTCTLDSTYMQDFLHAACYLELQHLHDECCHQAELHGIELIPDAA